MNKKVVFIFSLITIFSLILSILGTESIRFKLINYFIKKNRPDIVLELYRRILRKREVLKKSDSILISNKKEAFNEFENDIRIYCAQWIRSFLDEAIQYYKDRDFKNALTHYDYTNSKLNQLLPYLKEEMFLLTNISADEIQPFEKNHIYKLFKLALRAGDRDLKNLKGINLLPNPRLYASDNNEYPDGYMFSARDVGGILKSEVLRDMLEENINVYHVWQRDRAGWFATYFRLGRVPNNTSFIFSIEIKEVNTVNFNRPAIFTYTNKNKIWGSGATFEERFDSELLDNDWKRDFFVLKTLDSDEVFLEGWLVSWSDLRGEGDVYVRKPKLEIGNEATTCTDYLE